MGLSLVLAWALMSAGPSAADGPGSSPARDLPAAVATAADQPGFAADLGDDGPSRRRRMSALLDEEETDDDPDQAAHAPATAAVPAAGGRGLRARPAPAPHPRYSGRTTILRC